MVYYFIKCLKIYASSLFGLYASFHVKTDCRKGVAVFVRLCLPNCILIAYIFAQTKYCFFTRRVYVLLSKYEWIASEGCLLHIE